MEWAYVAGYFDGEGHVSLHLTKRGDMTRGLFWANTDKPSLDAMCAFMGVGTVHERHHGLPKKRAFMLAVARKVDLLQVLKNMIPHLIIKREKAEALRAYLIDHVDESRMVNFGKVAAVSSEQLQAWYAQGESYSDIAKRLGVHWASVGQAFRLRGLESRTQQAATSLKQKGLPKSPETIARMRAAQQKSWADPEYRARQADVRDKNQHTRAERMSVSLRAKWADPVFRERMVAVRQAQWAKPENRAAMSVAQRARRDKEAKEKAMA